MKIIGIAKDSLILEATRSEVEQYGGWYYNDGQPKLNLEVGTVIKVSELYHKLYKLKHCASTFNEMRRMLDEMKSAIDWMEPFSTNI